MVAAASLPFAFNGRNGALGEGIYTNDQAAQLFWTDWLQNGVGPGAEAGALRLPDRPAVGRRRGGRGHQRLAPRRLQRAPARDPGAHRAGGPRGARAAAAGAGGSVAASLTGLPYLAASFLAQSAFKETAMALLVLAFAVALGELRRRRLRATTQPHPRRAMVVALILLVVASVFVYSLPGLAWFALALPIWLALELATGGLRIDLEAVRDARPPPPRGRSSGWRSWSSRWARSPPRSSPGSSARSARCRPRLGGSARRCSRARRSASGRRATSGSSAATSRAPIPAVALGLLAAAIGAFGAVRRRDWGLVAMGASAVIVYVGARAFASIYVEAKALGDHVPARRPGGPLRPFLPGERRRGGGAGRCGRGAPRSRGWPSAS